MRRLTAAAILCCAGCASYFSSTCDPETLSPPTPKVIVPLQQLAAPDSKPSGTPTPAPAPASTESAPEPDGGAASH